MTLVNGPSKYPPPESSDSSDSTTPAAEYYPSPADLAELVKAHNALTNDLADAHSEIARLQNEIANRATKDIDGHDADQPPTSLATSKHGLQVLGQGSFGTIYYYLTHSIVYKTVADEAGHANLLQEFQYYLEMRNAIGNPNETSEFCTPQAWIYWHPASSEVVLFGSPEVKSTPSLSEVDKPPRLWCPFDLPTFSFDLIPSVPPQLAEAYKRLFIAPEAQSACRRIHLLRLYLGREDLPSQTSAFHPGLSADLPLDNHRYEMLRATLGSSTPMPSLVNVAKGMGRLLARMHWAVGLNGRDVELVLGSMCCNGLALPQCYVLDFNQCQRWLIPQPLEHLQVESLTTGTYADEDLESGAKRLARIISGQELYYPRPHQATTYPAFRKAYANEVQALLGGIDHDPRGWKARIQSAASAFLDEYEALDEAKVRRRAQRRPGGTPLPLA